MILLQAGIVPPLVTLLQSTSDVTITQAADAVYALSFDGMCMRKYHSDNTVEQCAQHIRSAGAVKSLAARLSSRSDAVLRACIQALMNLLAHGTIVQMNSDGSYFTDAVSARRVREYASIPVLVRLLDHASPGIQRCAAGCLLWCSYDGTYM